MFTIGNKFELLISPPKYGVHLTNIDYISLKAEENRYYMLVSLKNLSLINFFELKLKINPILSYKNSIFYFLNNQSVTKILVGNYVKNFKQKDVYKDDVIFKGENHEWIFKSVRSIFPDDFLKVKV